MIKYFLLIVFASHFSFAAEKVGIGSMISFTEDGVLLYGKIIYESVLGDDLFNVSDLERKQIIPRGAVLTAIQKEYAVGYYEGSINLISKDNEKDIKKISKIFFMIRKNGEIKFHEPSENPRFLGKEILQKVVFQ